ncbi:MAG TPA: class I SAM-dependent methyltransferase [Candidatus Andersenbacteria bacterium]|nr:class I SAM-dependent methyltransferase [Candidatus Andersenbacteria bacterium]
MKKTKEKQYQGQVELQEKGKVGMLGLTTSFFWEHDPKHLLFTLSRYKFAAKLVEGMNSVAEVGCGDATGARIIAGGVKSVDGYDFDPVFVENAKEINAGMKKLNFFVHDLLKKDLPKQYDAIYALDVIEHIQKKDESKFLMHAINSLNDHGMLILGTPNLTSQVYASQPSKEGHVNCKSHDELRALMKKHFHVSLLFSMNDEVVHTGYGPMAHYLFGVGICPKRR